MAAENDPALFATFTYGMEKNTLSSRLDTQPCPEAPENSLLLCSVKPLKFLDADWDAMFIFNNLNQLQQVKLVLPLEDKTDYREIQNGLRQEGWRPQFLETDDDAFDIIHAFRTKGSPAVEILTADFEKKALEKNGVFTINYLPEDYAATVASKKRIRTYDQAIDHAQENLVVASLISDNGRVSLLFTAPLLSRKNALRYGEMIKR